MFTINNPKYAKARERAAELLSEMTLEEKVAQLTQYIIGAMNYNPESHDASGQSDVGKCGSFLALAGADKVNKVQKIAIENTPHGIPIITGCDVIHGYRTTMPIPLSMGCTFEPEAVRECFAVAGKEAKSDGVHWAYAPMVDVARDVRWGRVAEGFGEDPYLASLMAEAAVRGYQDDAGVMACMKHFAAYSACEGGRDYNGCEVSDPELFNTYLPPFQAGIDAGCATLMSSFNTINGVPASANYHILTEILRNKMGFDGFVVSDYDSVHETVRHGYAEDLEDAAVKGYDAGVDVVMSGNLYNDYLPKAVKEGKIKESQIDDSVLRILAAKYLIGVMDEPFLDESAKDSFITDESRKVALRAAEKGTILLENDGTLPLNPENAKGLKIGLCGPFARDRSSLLGAWAGACSPKQTITIEEGFKETYADAEIICEEGISFTGKENTELSLEKMSSCDIIFAAVGEHSSESGEATSKTNLSLPEKQLIFIDRLFELGKPVVLIISAGRPLILTDMSKKANAVLYIWAPGIEAGHAVSNVVSGKFNPSGKCAISFPHNVGQMPLFYNCKSTGRPNVGNNSFESKYIDAPWKALYPFGYGMSYTSFKYTDISLDKKELTENDTLNVSLTVTNTGDYDGTDVVQLYIRDVAASLVRPVKELKAFKKIFLKAGESKEVTFEVTKNELSFYNAKLEKVVEKGLFMLWVAHHCEDDLNKFEFKIV